MSQLQVITGPMMAGKTTELLKRLLRYSSIGKKCLYVNSILDTRGETYSTHNPIYKEVFENENITFFSTKLLDHGYIYYEYFDVIAIDEAQFFTYLKDIVVHMVDDMKKIVIVSGLDLDFKRNKFGEINELIPFADKTTKLFSYCMECSKIGKVTNALFTHKTVEGDSEIDVGGSEKYKPLCRECFISSN